MLAWWRKDRRDAQRQTEPDDLAQHVGMGVCALEARVVVELRVGRTTVLPPVGFQPFTEPARPQSGTNPGTANRAPEGTGRQHIQSGTGLQREIFNDIKSVQFRLPGGHVRQIPARGRRGAAHPPHALQSAVRFENPSDGAQARPWGFGSGRAQRVLDGLCAHEAQIPLPQFLPQSEDPSLHAEVGLTTVPARRMGLIRPVHLRQLLSVCAGQPVLQVSQTDAKASRHGALSLSAPYRRDHRLPFCFRELFTRNTVSD